jgi:signal transduction histidine kinase
MDALSVEFSTEVDNALRVLPQLRVSLPTNYENKQRKLRQQMADALVLLRPHLASENRQAAQSMAKELLAKLRFDGNDGYFYVYELDGTCLVHPVSPSLVGTNIFNLQDEDGVFVFQRVLAAADQAGGGFAPYKWENPTTHRPSRKYGYAMIIPEWGWMVGTGVYFNDVEAALLHIHDSLARTGYVKSVTITVAGTACILLVTLAGWMLLAQLRNSNTELQRLRQEADSALIERSQFFSGASHDFAQRLHALRLLAHSARQVQAGSKIAAAKMSEALEDLEAYVRDVLEFARIESCVITPRCKPVALQSIFQKLLLHFEGIATDRGIDLRIRTTDAIVNTDEAMLLRILENVISNAIKFTRRRVLVAARRCGHTWSVEIWDQGIGIPAGAEEAIFQAFYQHEAYMDRRSEGVGLGLAIVRRLAVGLNYVVAVKSRAGRGTVIKIQGIVDVSSRDSKGSGAHPCRKGAVQGRAGIQPQAFCGDHHRPTA